MEIVRIVPHSNVVIKLSADEVGEALQHWLSAQNVIIQGVATVMTDGDLCKGANVHIGIDDSLMVQGRYFDKRHFGK